MKQLTVLAVLAAMTLFGIAQQASAQSVPNMQGLQKFTVQDNYMSLSGYLRWQYFKENNVWISSAEASELVRSQQIAAR